MSDQGPTPEELRMFQRVLMAEKAVETATTAAKQVAAAFKEFFNSLDEAMLKAQQERLVKKAEADLYLIQFRAKYEAWKAQQPKS